MSLLQGGISDLQELPEAFRQGFHYSNLIVCLLLFSSFFQRTLHLKYHLAEV